jgi:hypothetical protein
MTAEKCEICNTYGSSEKGSISMVYGVRALCRSCIDVKLAVVL